MQPPAVTISRHTTEGQDMEPDDIQLDEYEEDTYAWWTDVSLDPTEELNFHDTTERTTPRPNLSTRFPAGFMQSESNPESTEGD